MYIKRISQRSFFMFKCPRCKQEYPSYNSLSKHTRTAYKLSGEALYCEYHKITDIPTCKCGCGTPTKWRIDRGYGEYVTGHNAKGSTNPMFGKNHTEEARNNISTKRKEKFANGEYTFINSDKWSNAAKKVWQRVGHRERMIKLRKEWIKNNGFKGEPSNLEKHFANILSEHAVELESQYYLSGKFFDFWIPDTNILIECDGNFYHCHPESHPTPIYEIQKSNIINDAIKNQIASENGYTLLRFWESDINDRPFWVVQQILEHINQYKPTI
jgi:very-short-patch-repair endonuclease